jgi:hemolysin type calcium-binding protein
MNGIRLQLLVRGARCAWMRARSVALAFATAAVLLLLPSTSGAAVTIGADVNAASGSPFFCGEPCTTFQNAHPSRPYSAPAEGVVVRWRVRDGTGTLRLRIIRPAGPGTYTGAGTSAPGAVPPGVVTFDTRLPITAGDFIGLDYVDANSAVGARPLAGGQNLNFFPPLADGQTRAADGTDNDVEALYSADIEPDADRDGFGDETQDLCSKDASTQGLCGGPCANDRSGGPGPDVIIGTIAGDRINGLGGNDRISGLAGDDCLLGGSGSDRLSGSGGKDRLGGDAGNDRVGGGSGNDTIAGGSGKDRLGGDAGNDRLSGGSGNDTIAGGAGKNRLSGGPGNDVLRARNRKRDTVSCGAGRKDLARIDRFDRVSGCERIA